MAGLYYENRKEWYEAIRKCLCKCPDVNLNDGEFAEWLHAFIRDAVTIDWVCTIKDLIDYGGEYLTAGVIKMAEKRMMISGMMVSPRMKTIHVMGNSLKGVNQQICSDMGVYLYDEQEKKESLVWTLVDNLKCWRDEETGMICGTVQMPCFCFERII